MQVNSRLLLLLLLLLWLPVSQKIFNRVLYTSGRRRRTCEWLPWSAQIVAFTVGTAFLLGCGQEGSKLINSCQEFLRFCAESWSKCLIIGFTHCCHHNTTINPNITFNFSLISLSFIGICLKYYLLIKWYFMVHLT